jgi:hypothetical protein
MDLKVNGLRVEFHLYFLFIGGRVACKLIGLLNRCPVCETIFKTES